MKQYYLISHEEIEEICSKIVVMYKAAEFMEHEGFDNMSETLRAYSAELGVIVDGLVECNVVPQSES